MLSRSSLFPAIAATIAYALARPAVSQTAPTPTMPQPAPRSQQPDGPKEQKQKPGRSTIPTLDTVVISADEGVPTNYPGGRDIVDADTIATYPDASFDSVLRRTPGVYFLPENSNDARINIGLRGNDPRRSGLTALLVDGIPIAEAPYGNTDVDGLPLPVERVARIDVIRGGASIRYGPNAAGGVVNLITAPIPETPLFRFTSRYGSDAEYSASTEIGGTWGQFGALVTAVTKGGDGFRANSDYRDNDGALRLRYAIDPAQTIEGYFSRFTELHAEQAGGLTQTAYDADPRQSLRPGSDFSYEMNRYVLHYANRIDDDTAFEAKLWHQTGSRELNDFRPVVAPYTVERQQNSEFDSSALELSYAWRTRWLGLDHRFYHSLRYLTETNDELYLRMPIGTGTPNTPLELDAKFRGRAFSLFTEDVIALTEDLDWGIGFRAESITMTGIAESDDNQIFKNYTELLPETNLTWSLAENTAVYGSFQQSFYPPQYETGFDPASVLYAPTDPEHSTAYELGLRSRDVPGLGASIALFDNEFKDKIDYVNTANGKVPVNSGKARSYGVEGSFDYDLGSAAADLAGLSAYGTVTVLRSTILEGVNEGNDTPNSPHLLASWGAMYELGQTGLWGRVGGSYSDSTFRDPANTSAGSADGIVGSEPSYSLWDLAVGWNQRPDRTGVAVAAGVTNLFDEDYFRRFATGIYPGRGRAAFVQLSYAMNF
ncbi:MAG: TonB-dependent receptor [Planctomycetes bacterium]|nr:TonB-dependent receptor [Planctomycetota bacterium]